MQRVHLLHILGYFVHRAPAYDFTVFPHVHWPNDSAVVIRKVIEPPSGYSRALFLTPERKLVQVISGKASDLAFRILHSNYECIQIAFLNGRYISAVAKTDYDWSVY